MSVPGLLAFLRRPALAPFWERVREKLERQGGVAGSVGLDGAGAEELAAVADLLGLRARPRAGSRVRLERLDRALSESRFGVGLVEAMEALGGPLRDRPAEREASEGGWARLWQGARRHPVVAQRGGLEAWLAETESTGLLRRLAGAGASPRLPAARRLLEDTLAILGALETDESDALRAGREVVRRRVLAVERLGSSHALDDGTPVATLVLRALATLAGAPPPASAAERRELWRWAGVVPDDLSCDVLVLGLAPAGAGLLPEHLRAFAAAGEPARLTLRQLAGARIALPPGTAVHACENPALVAVAADALGAACRPLVCTGGMPNAAALALLSALAAGGATIRYHGDFDWGGLRIANTLGRAVPLTPWRFTAADYRAALADPTPTLPLEGKPTAADWDPDLAAAMEEAGLAVEEEALVEILVEDLRR
jgi:uncharacterized protein (TIGR02679 family)